jgi:ABC-type antimicrobial peptide transport system permease subunit
MDYDWAGVFNLKLNPDQSPSVSLAAIGAVFREKNPGSPFEYKFADEEYGKKFATEERIGKLATFFAILAIFISCLGLFGLASFMAEQRTKEIGVRKVLGASVAGVTALLTRDFLKLVVVAMLIASPLAWYFMQGWLTDFAYRIEIQWWMFALTGSMAVLIAFLTVAGQAIKAALVNPVKSLKSE